MIKQPSEITVGSTLTADVCVVGAGAAGIALAVELGRAGVDVLLIPGGDHRYRTAHQELYKGSATNDIPLERSRIRRFGGTTSVWGGRCIPFDEIDFEHRPHVPDADWPFGLSELSPYYSRAHEHLDIGTNPSFDVKEVLPDEPPQLIEGFASEAVETHKVEKWSLPTNLGKKYKKELDRSPNVTVLMDAHLIEAQTNEANEELQQLRCVAGDSRRFNCVANQYVFAMGGLETTRHLLHLIGNPGTTEPNDHLGRYFMTHLSGAIAEVSIDPSVEVINRYETDREGVYCRRRIQISQEAQREHGLLNFAAFLHDPPLQDPRHRDPVLSLLFFAKGLRSVALRIPAEYSVELAYGRFSFRDHLPHLRNILLGLPRLIASAPGLIYRRLLRRRKLPSVILSKPDNRYTLYYHVEHAPTSTSRVTLSDETDRHGLRRLHVSMEHSDLDVDSILRAHEIIRLELERTGVGRLEYLFDDSRAAVIRHIGFGGHQMGTTRMAHNEHMGVVNPDGQVFGISNLFVAGPSTFVTGSHANPVLTIVAMAIRLADHLIAQRRVVAGS